MKKIIVEEYILKNIQNALRLSANLLDSRKRETAADRQIEYAERLTDWLLSNKKGKRPTVIPE